MTWDLSCAPDGARVTVFCENVPYGIRKEDRLRSTLDNLAKFVEASEA
jgi:hypothetical protein